MAAVTGPVVEHVLSEEHLKSCQVPTTRPSARSVKHERIVRTNRNSPIVEPSNGKIPYTRWPKTDHDSTKHRSINLRPREWFRRLSQRSMRRCTAALCQGHLGCL